MKDDIIDRYMERLDDRLLEMEEFPPIDYYEDLDEYTITQLEKLFFESCEETGSL